MAEIAYQPEGSDYGDRRFELSRNLNQMRRAGTLPEAYVRVGLKSAALIVLIL